MGYSEGYRKVLHHIYQTVGAIEDPGEVAQYIPELARVNPDKFGVCLLAKECKPLGIGNWQTKFSIQSIAKVFSLSLAYKLLDEQLWQRVGVEPSGNAFNSLVQLESDKGFPRNPFINAGAMVICDMLISTLDSPKADFINFVRDVSANEDINYSESIASSEALCGFRNKALCHFIKSFGNIKNDPEEVLDFYFYMCSIEMSCEELTMAFKYLAFNETTTSDGHQVLTLHKTKRINAIMQTCGFYDESGEFSFKVGLPGKSGVGGGIIAIHPEKYAIATWSPRLNNKGNSYKGMKLLEQFTTETELSIF